MRKTSWSESLKTIIKKKPKVNRIRITILSIKQVNFSIVKVDLMRTQEVIGLRVSALKPFITNEAFKVVINLTVDPFETSCVINNKDLE